MRTKLGFLWTGFMLAFSLGSAPAIDSTQLWMGDATCSMFIISSTQTISIGGKPLELPYLHKIGPVFTPEPELSPLNCRSVLSSECLSLVASFMADNIPNNLVMVNPVLTNEEYWPVDGNRKKLPDADRQHWRQYWPGFNPQDNMQRAPQPPRPLTPGIPLPTPKPGLWPQLARCVTKMGVFILAIPSVIEPYLPGASSTLPGDGAFSEIEDCLEAHGLSFEHSDP